MRTPTVRFGVLGTVVAEVDGRPVRLMRRRERAVLAMLLLEAGCWVPQLRLYRLLWPEKQPAEPRAAISTHVSRLRAALAAAGATGHDVPLIRRGDGYLMDIDPRCVDAHRFADLVRAGQAETGARRVALLREALALWRGPALVDAGEYVRVAAGARWELMRNSALRTCLEAELAEGGSAELVWELTELAATDPLSEQVAALLMRALSQAGRRSEALEVYRRTRARIVAELGIEPGVELRELHRRILAGQNTESVLGTSATLPPRSVRRSGPAFVAAAPTHSLLRSSAR